MIIITANKIQISTLKRQSAWQKATLLSWQDAIQLLNENSGIKILQAVEQEYIWQKIIEQENTEHSTATESLAQAAQQAWWLSKHWLINWQELQHSQNINTQWFNKIAKQYWQYCKKNNCIDEAENLYSLAEQLTTNPIELKKSLSSTEEQIFFYGFLKLTPLQEKFFNLLQAKPIKALATIQQKSNLTCFDNLIDELDAIINTAILQGKEKSTQKLAIIVPELTKYRAHIESKLVLADTPFPWKIFSPQSFIDQGLVKTALAILQLHYSKKIALDDLASLLRSPYFGQMPEEQDQRANFLLKLRELQLTHFDWDVIIKTAQTWPALQTQFHLLQTSQQRKSQSLTDWMQDWQKLLLNLHFPNSPILNSDEIELYKRFEQMQQEFSKLIPWQQKFSAAEALNLFKRLCKKTFWDKEDYSSKKPTLAILGVIDALNYSFDQAWLTDATQGNLPFKLSANSLLDKLLQRKYQVWAADQAIQDELAFLSYAELKTNCNDLHLSYAKEDQGQIKNPAAFCRDWPLITGTFDETTIQAFTPFSSQETIAPWQQSHLPGGSSALKSQRLCPMQAFAKYRLNLQSMPEAVLGLTAIERGIITHRALQLIWQQLQSQQKLIALSETELAQLIHRVISVSLRVVPWSRRKLLPKALLDLELQFLASLLQKWLALEASRPAFSIHALEKETHAVFAGHKWRLRIDRIDQLEDGRLLLIDYKTGLTSINHWQIDLFTEPQLPLYVVTHALNIDAIAFAEVSAKNLKMIGLSREILPLGNFGVIKAVEDWGQLKIDWQQALTQLTDDFVNSDAQLNPLEGNATCARCGLQSFCRIHDKMQ